MLKDNWLLATFRLNWANAAADKRAFWSLLVMMGAQNLLYFMLWVIVFSRISSLRGWGLPEVAFLYGCGAAGYGLFFTLFGGLNRLADLVHDGTLDVYLGRPRPVLLQAIAHRMRADSLGDIVAGIAMIVLFAPQALAALPLVLGLSVMSGLVFASFRLIMHTLAFWGVGSEAGENGFIAFLIAATNPQSGFGAVGRLILLSIFPAGYIGLLPVEILRNFTWPMMALQVAGSLGVFAFALFLFHAGLKRYASGNQFVTLR